MKVDSSMVDVSNGSGGLLLCSAGSMLGSAGSDGSPCPVDIDAGEGASSLGNGVVFSRFSSSFPCSFLAKVRHVCTVSCQ